MAFELIKVSELPELTTPADANVLPIQDGDYLKRILFANLKDAAVGDMESSLAAAYDSTATYAVGDYCIYEGQLYRCTTAITTAEAWTSGHWTAAVLTDDIASDLSAEASTRSTNDNALAADIAEALGDLAAVYSTSATYAVGDYCTKDGQLYRCTTAITTAEAWTAAHWSAVALGDDTSDLRSAFNYNVASINSQFPDINGAILPPQYSIGARIVSNGAESFVPTNTKRLSIKPNEYLTLKAGDVVARNTSVIRYFGGGYSTDGGTTWTAITTRDATYTVPSNGLYFFWLYKINEADFTSDDVKNAWSYMYYTRSGSMKDTVEELSNDDTVDNIKTAIGYEVAPVTPTDYYTMPNTGAGINYQGVDTVDASTDSSGYIDMTNLYDIAIIVQNRTKYALGGIFYYTASKQFIRRDLPGTSYDFSIYNGEDVIWLNIDKTVANAKYVRFVEDNSKGYKFWVVENAPQATVLDDYSKLPFFGKTIVNFGDSIIGATRPPHDVSSYLATNTGAKVYNCGFGGCEMSEHADSNYDAFSMYRLAYAVANNTWTLQETASTASGMPAYFAETVALLKTIDFSKVDIVTIGYGTNDWNNGTELDNGGNSNKAYFADALRYSIETLLTAFPNLKIFVCTQTYRFFMDASYNFVDDSNTHTNSHGKTLIDFVEKTIEVAEQYNLPCINNYNIGMGKYSRSYYFYPTDGTHPKPEGNRLIAEHIASELF